MSLNEQELARETVFTGKIIKVDVEEVELPNGETSTREIVRHPGAVCCLAINSQNQCLLVRQWREPVKKISLEIPAGKIDADDDSKLAAMKRELNEETGYKADFFEQLISFNTALGFSDEEITLFYCDSLTNVEAKLAQDEDEFVTKTWVDLPTAKQLILDGEIFDLKTIYAISYWENMQLRSEQNARK